MVGTYLFIIGFLITSCLLTLLVFLLIWALKERAEMIEIEKEQYRRIKEFEEALDENIRSKRRK